MSSITKSRAARELIAANRARKPPATVDEFLAAGGKIERLPEGASGIKPRDGGLRFDHSQGRALIKREFRLYP